MPGKTPDREPARGGNNNNNNKMKGKGKKGEDEKMTVVVPPSKKKEDVEGDVVVMEGVENEGEGEDPVEKTVAGRFHPVW